MAKAPKSIAQSKDGARPTRQAYGALDAAFDHFNRTLFGGCLPPCLITLQRHAHSYGYFSGRRFGRVHGKAQGEIDEIAINPMHVEERTPEKVLSTLVHEMAHSWQHHFGKEPTRCYHDRQWAAKMKEVGLYPSATGAPGGKETGPKVSHYIIEGGVFTVACKEFLKANETAFYQDRQLTFASRVRAKAKAKGGEEGGEGEGEEGGTEKSTGRAKFVCLGCKLNAWAKPGANLRCGDCDRPMHVAAGKKDEEDEGDGDE